MNTTAPRIKKGLKFKNEPEFEETLSIMSSIIESNEEGAFLKVVEYLNYLSSLKIMPSDLESCYLITAISMFACEVTKPFLVDHSMIAGIVGKVLPNVSNLAKIYMRPESKIKVPGRVTKVLTEVLTEIRSLVKVSLGLCSKKTLVLLELLSKILCLSASCGFNLTLLALKNLGLIPVESHVFPTYTNLRYPYLPVYNSKEYTLVLDLDETLMHLQDGIIKVRPGATEFIKKMSAIFEVVLFTASMPIYADVVMSLVDPNNLIKLRLYRNHTTITGQTRTKDLETLGRDLKKIIIVDNLKESFSLQPENGICIDTWLGDKNDTKLSELGLRLEEICLRRLPDLRQFVNI